MRCGTDGPPRPPRRRPSRSKECSDFCEEGIQPIVVDPMSSTFEGYDPGSPEVAGPAVARWVRRPALVAVHEECRAGDPLPEVFPLGRCDIDGWLRADVV